jgi:hypothetical protein
MIEYDHDNRGDFGKTNALFDPTPWHVGELGTTFAWHPLVEEFRL